MNYYYRRSFVDCRGELCNPFSPQTRSHDSIFIIVVRELRGLRIFIYFFLELHAKLPTLKDQGLYSGILPLDRSPTMADESCLRVM
jgi:hypothetical protein